MLFHKQSLRFYQLRSSQHLLLRVKTFNNPDYIVELQIEGTSSSTQPMFVTARTRHYTYYQAEMIITLADKRYRFCCKSRETGVIIEETPYFEIIKKNELYFLPEWIYSSVLYQIFPDRFANGNSKNDPIQTEPWDQQPTIENFFGGDLEGILQKITYLKELGINLIWLNPIFASSSNHRYNTRDYLQIDPALGDAKTFSRFMKTLHRHGIRVILDGVFNHTGTDFFAFQDVVLHGADSPYRDWYYFEDFPVQMYPKPNYRCWWGIASLPKLNVDNILVRKYLLTTGVYWIKNGKIDGWRLDVPNEIEISFWPEFRQHVKKANPNAYIVGEIWRDARPWLNQNYFDGVMNYLFRDLIIGCFAEKKINLSTLDFLLGVLRLRYPESANFGLMNLLGSHDTARIITVFQKKLAQLPGHTGSYREAIEHLRPALILQFTYPGIPHIYYGDEVGMVGEADPDCRRTMPWDTKLWHIEQLQFYRKLIKIRGNSQLLKRGFFEPIFSDDTQGVYCFARHLNGKRVVVVLNSSDIAQKVEIPRDFFATGDIWKDELTGKVYHVTEKQLVFELEANFGAILILQG